MNNTNIHSEDKPRTDTLKEPILEKKILISARDPKYSKDRMAVIGYTVREEDVKKMNDIKEPVEKIDDKDKKIQELENDIEHLFKIINKLTEIAIIYKDIVDYRYHEREKNSDKEGELLNGF